MNCTGSTSMIIIMWQLETAKTIPSRNLSEKRSTEEVEAVISFAVCAYYGIATGGLSFGYIAAWSKDKDLRSCAPLWRP